ncbi:helix-hairpin-helix domain-containing protein [Dactylosporangium sp. AC04546]|uniref:ComEA family DNA-binding protein n=1 Tax=Dactylosporangium sp. AC04546 TaxID=2862460 RepID=UPI001EDF0479|nr:ComEA family DNA-binding protein [Dactylosporangium sp. AC04546]WVK82774.1 helix-hairpin-helix domain-containing protein [Dactylosporangium sp. AC04546]
MRRSGETDDAPARVVGLPPDLDDDLSYPWDATFRPPRGTLPTAASVADFGLGADDGVPVVARGGGGLAAFDPRRPGVRVLAVIAAVVVAAAAFYAWHSRPRVTPAPEVAVSTAAPAQPSSSPALLVVSVTGKVNRPGLVRLPAGARVADAIEAAGGPLPGTDLTGLNLARKLVDGEMVAVGVPQPPGAPAPTGAAAGGLVNLNTATAAELQTLPGIGEVLAQRIIEFRESHGGFRAVADLRKVEGIGDAKFQQLKDRVTV